MRKMHLVKSTHNPRTLCGLPGHLHCISQRAYFVGMLPKYKCLNCQNVLNAKEPANDRR